MLGRLIVSLRDARRARRIAERLSAGVARHNSGDLDGAIGHFRAALALAPAHVDALCLAGNALCAKGDTETALSMLRSAAEIAPERGDILLLLASVLPLPRCRSEMIGLLRRVLALQPDSLALRVNYRLATLLRDDGAIDEAIGRFRVALEVHGDTPDLNVHAQLANLLHLRGDAEGARAHYAHACELTGDDSLRLRRVTIVPPIPASAEHIARIRATVQREAEHLLERRLELRTPEVDIGHTDFYLAYHGANDRPLRELLAGLYLHAYPTLGFRSPHIEAICRRRGGKLRIGVISKYLHEHTIGRLNAGFLRLLDRQRFELTVFVWKEASDAIAAEIRMNADEVVTLGDALAENRTRIAEQRLDVLLYCDIGMEPMTYFLAFARLAPVQCATWGHPVTTGLPHIDYFISSELIEPADGADHYSEVLACLPASCAHVCYARPPVAAPVERARLGVGDGQTVYACMQTLFKFHPDFDALLAAILRADPRGVLLLLDNPKHLREPLLKRWEPSMGDLLERIRFLPKCGHAEYLGRLAAADVVLDTPHFSGGNSSLEALATGTPLVTLPGAFAKSRLTLAAYRRMGSTECVARDARTYVEKAVRLGTDAVYRDSIRSSIADASDRLFDDVGTVRALERIFTDALARARLESPLRG